MYDRGWEAFWIMLIVIVIVSTAISCKYSSDQSNFDDLATKWIFNAEQVPPPGTVVFQGQHGRDAFIQWDNIELGWFSITLIDRGYQFQFPDFKSREAKNKTRFVGKMILPSIEKEKEDKNGK